MDVERFASERDPPGGEFFYDLTGVNPFGVLIEHVTDDVGFALLDQVPTVDDFVTVQYGPP